MSTPIEKDFEDLFGFSLRKTIGVSQHLKMMQTAVVIAKLRQLAQDVNDLRTEADELSDKYKDNPAVSFEEATTDLAAMEEINSKMVAAKETFERAVKIAGGGQFSVSGKLEDYISPKTPIDLGALAAGVVRAAITGQPYSG